MFDVVFRDENFIAVDKPAGWLSVPSRFEKEDSRSVLGREVEKLCRSSIFPIHRLDLEVSGLVLFALNANAHRRGSKWFEGREISKIYQGVSGSRDFAHWPVDLRRADRPIPVGEEQEWRCKILRGKRRSYEHVKGDDAVTKAILLSESKGEIRWQLSPLTGRSHQLRFEMSRHGFPLKGDSLYGSPETWPGAGIALRAVRLDFSKISDRGEIPEMLSVKGLF